MNHKKQQVYFTAALLLLSLVLSSLVLAAPQGASITSNTTDSGPTATPANRTDSRGTITTLVMDSVQQDQHWKAYVGNVTGSLSLDDASQNTIYDWTLTGITGQVYASRFNNLTWTSVSCAPQALIRSESAFHNMTDADSDDINSTFNWTVHKEFNIGSTTINQNTCNSTVTHVNDARRTPTISSTFQELLLQDANNQFLFMTSLDDDSQGYNGGTSFDFQMIVAESDVKAQATTYYFYIELR